MTYQLFNNIVALLQQQGKKVSTMESCTGGGVANAITNIEGASRVIQFAAVTYSNDFKIKMGVPKETIDTYTVYSSETARDMSKHIAEFSGADYGIGVTGKLRRVDENNPIGENDCVYYSIWNKATNTYATGTVVVDKSSRAENKDLVLRSIAIDMYKILMRKNWKQ